MSKKKLTFFIKNNDLKTNAQYFYTRGLADCCMKTDHTSHV